MSEGVRLEIRAGPRRRRQVLELPSEAWMIAHDVTLARVEDRVHRAFRTIRAVPDPDAKWRRQNLKASWPEMQPEPWEQWRQYDSEEVRELQELVADNFEPKPHDVSDALGNLPTRPYDWLKVLERREVKLVRLVAYGFGYAFLGSRWSMSRQYVHRCYKDAIVRCWNAAIEQALRQAAEQVRERERRRAGARDQADTTAVGADAGGGG